MAAAVAAAFAAAQRMIDRIHGLRSRVWADAHVPRTAGLADADVDPIEIPDLPDGRAAGAANAAHFAGGENDHRPLALFGAQAGDAAGRAHQLAALARIHFDIVDFKAAGDVGQRQAVAKIPRR